MTARDLEQEIRHLRARIAALIEQAADNERLLKKSQQRELELLKAENLPQLFEAVCNGLAISYCLEIVTLVLVDPDHELRHLLMSDQLSLERFPRVALTDNLSAIAPQFSALKRPWLGGFNPAAHGRLFGGRQDVQSIAIIPLLRQDQLHGSINFGSTDPERFSRRLGTDFLAHLGVITAVAVENAVNRSRLVRSGLTDFLTGWHNRRYLDARLPEELARARRQKTSMACFVIDLDHFKEINDRYGHLAGDLALRTAAQRIARQIRAGDTAARFGGDEFVVVAPAISVAQAHALAERIRQAVCATAVELEPGVVTNLSLSIGVAIMDAISDSELAATAERLLNDADTALYQAKQGGRNRTAMLEI